MLGLLKNPGRAIVSRDMEGIAILTVVCDQSGLGNLGEGQDIGDPCWMVPYIAISGKGPHEIGLAFAGLCVYG